MNKEYSTVIIKSFDENDNVNYGPYTYGSSLAESKQKNYIISRNEKDYKKEKIKPSNHQD